MMPDKKRESDRRLREKLEAFQPEVPPHLWDEIKSTLDQDTAIYSNEALKPRLRSTSIYRWSVAASIAFVIGIYWFLQVQRPTVIYLRGDDEVILTRNDARTDPMLRTLTDVPGLSTENISKHDPGDRHKLLERSRLVNDIRIQHRTVGQEEPSTKSKSDIAGQFINEQESLASTSTRDKSHIDFVTQSNGNQPLDIDPALLKTEAIVSIVPSMLIPTMEEDPTIKTAAAQALTGAAVQQVPAPVPRLLNMAVAQLDKRQEKFLSFSADEEGSLQIDINPNFNLTQNHH